MMQIRFYFLGKRSETSISHKELVKEYSVVNNLDDFFIFSNNWYINLNDSHYRNWCYLLINFRGN